MVRGFYEIGSGIMAQNKVLDTIANNLANANTTGYKAQNTVTTSFENMLTAMVGTDQYGNDVGKYLYDRAYINVVSDTYTNFAQGAVEQTERKLDFCITGNGFFQIRTDDGGRYYTRNGEFDLDEEGYLYLAGAGRVQNVNGQDIYLGTDNIVCSSNGELYNEDTGAYYGQIALYDFDDYHTLVEYNNSMYETDSAPFAADGTLANQMLESSNIDMAEEITSAMQAQNLLQSQANILQMYADILNEGSTRISKIL